MPLHRCPRSTTPLAAWLGLALLFGLASAVPSAFAAEKPPARVWDVDHLELLLPRREIPEERLPWQGREDSLPGRNVKADPPPVAPVRNCAEWEPCTGVLIRYPLGLPYGLLRDLDDDVILHVVVSSAYLATAQTSLAANGVDMGRVEFLVKPNDSIWTRDYGPWFVFDGNGQLTVVDHVYNRPYRPNDDLIPVYFGQQQGLPVIRHDMWHTGGNYMTDGAHVSCSTRLVYDEAASANSMTPAEVDQLMADYYGIDTYQVLEYIESGGIHHIDTWAKFLDEETVLVKEVWPAHWTYSTLEQRATLLASLPASTGRNYRVRRVYCYDIGGGSPASYTNSLILNDWIYVPCFGNAAYDSAAVRTYRNAVPGYDVRGYYSSGWLDDDALHCRAKGVMDSGMLRVEHVPVREAQVGPAPVEARVEAHSGAAVIEVDLVYRQDGGDWIVLTMDPGGGGRYAATIPEPADATTTDYYVLATDGSGRTEGMPRPAPAGWYSFEQAPDLSAAPAPNRIAQLHQNYPNPFNPHTTFRFELRSPDHVELVVLDLRGRLVRRLLDGERAAGVHEIPWDGKDDAGRPLPSGTYLYRLRAAGLQYSRRATLVK
jgi:agmatine deiminase